MVFSFTFLARAPQVDGECVVDGVLGAAAGFCCCSHHARRAAELADVVVGLAVAAADQLVVSADARRLWRL